MRKLPITPEEVQSCMNLLHNHYQDNAKVYLFYNFYDYLKWTVKHKAINLETIKKVYKGHSMGAYNTKDNYIHIYLFNVKVDQRYFKQCVIHTLYHELRHFYQYNFKRKYWDIKKGISYSLDDPRYREIPIEKDANKFAARMMKRHKQEISKLLNVYPNWELMREV